MLNFEHLDTESRDVMVTGVTVNHGKITMVTAAVDNRGVEKSWDIPKSTYACAARNMFLLCSEEDMVEGGSHSSVPHSIYPPLKKPNVKSGHILVIIRMQLNAGAEKKKLLRGATHPIYANITLNCSANAR